MASYLAFIIRSRPCETATFGVRLARNWRATRGSPGPFGWEAKVTFESTASRGIASLSDLTAAIREAATLRSLGNSRPVASSAR